MDTSNVTRVEFPQEILGQRFGGLAVIKTAPETGVLVCLNDRNGCSMSIRVDVPLYLGDILLRRVRLYSLGCWGDMDVDRAPFSSLGLDERRVGEEEPQDVEAREEYWVSINKKLKEPRDRAVQEACRRLGVTTLLTGENADSEVEGLTIVRVPCSTEIVVE